MEPHGPDPTPHAPSPSLWPVGFAVGIAVLLTGVVVGWVVVGIGAALALVFGFLWARDVGGRTAPPPPAAEPTAPVAADEGEIQRFPRSKFLEATTLGLGGVIGGLITVPVTWFAVVPTFLDQKHEDVDIGPLDVFPEGEVSRRTAYLRNNGELEGQPSLTIISNRCAHLGCPVQPGTIEEDKSETVQTSNTVVTRIPATPAAFTCPCHGGAYDTEGNRIAGPPVRALDRYEYEIRNGRVFLVGLYSVGKVKGEGKEAIVTKYALMNPGLHVDGPEQILYPIGPRR